MNKRCNGTLLHFVARCPPTQTPLCSFAQDSPKDGDPDETGQQPASETGTEDSPPALRRFSELAAAFDSLVQRVQAVGAATFFALDQPGGTGRSQLEWLALQVREAQAARCMGCWGSAAGRTAS
jgi:hypothetical protein